MHDLGLALTCGIFAAAAARDGGRAPKEKLFYEVVPMHGVFGHEVHADVLEKTLKRSRVRCDVIVLDIDSPGGVLAEAKKVAEVLRDHDKHFEYVALIRNGASVSVYAAFACDEILLTEGGLLGGAAPEFDAQMSSIVGAELEAIADRHEWNPDIARAMVIPSATLSLWHDAGGSRRLGRTPPPGARASSRARRRRPASRSTRRDGTPTCST